MNQLQSLQNVRENIENPIQTSEICCGEFMLIIYTLVFQYN